MATETPNKTKLIASAVIGVFTLSLLSYLVLPSVLLTFIVPSVTSALSDGQCESNLFSPGVNVDQNANQEQLAALMYGTAISEGMGPNGALMALYVSTAESNITNSTKGDGSPGNTSRGVFQQLEGWGGKNAWSGQNSPPETLRGDYFTKDNAWGVNGWAENDPRMNPVQSTERFLDALRVRIKQDGLTVDQFNATPLTDEEMLKWSYEVQRWNKTMPAVIANNTRAIAPARGLFATLAANPAVIPPGVQPDSRLAGNGVMLIGDSLMVGVAPLIGLTAFGGPVTSFTETGINPSASVAALTGKERTPRGKQWSKAFTDAPSRIYVSLGSNNPGNTQAFSAAVTTIMDFVGPNRTVYWNTLAHKKASRYNKVLLQASENYPNLKLVDVNALVVDNPSLLAADGINFTPTGLTQIWELGREAMSGIAGSTVVSAQSDLCSEEFLRSSAGGQTIIGPDGCPVDVPTNTLRDGAQEIGPGVLCSQAVAQAATPQAALAIKWAFTHLGIPYACQAGQTAGTMNRNGPDFYDCSSFLAAAYAETSGLGIAGHSTLNMLRGASGNYQDHLLTERMAGDLIVTKSGGSPSGRHVAMYLGRAEGREWIVHTNSCGDVSKIERYSPSGYTLNVARPIAATSSEEKELATSLNISTIR